MVPFRSTELRITLRKKVLLPLAFRRAEHNQEGQFGFPFSVRVMKFDSPGLAGTIALILCGFLVDIFSLKFFR